LPDRIRAGVTAFFNVNLSWLESVVERGKDSGEFSFKDSPAHIAVLLLSTLEGAMVVGRGLNRSEIVTLVGRTALCNVLTVK